MTDPSPIDSARISLLHVDRAIAELRRSEPVLVLGAGGRKLLIQAAENFTKADAERLEALAGTAPALALSGRRALFLSLTEAEHKAVLITAGATLDDDVIAALADPVSVKPAALPDDLSIEAADDRDDVQAAVQLAKLARLLPAAMVAPIDGLDDVYAWATEHDIFPVWADHIAHYHNTAAHSLTNVGTARVPLMGAENTRIMAYRPLDGGIEHLAIVIGDPDPDKPVLIRIHSECFTGDLLGSLRCDCGDQLRGAIEAIAAEGSGVLLYLAQEGRGIGLVNKLRAYQLQDQGFDTLDANGQLGFDDDERVYLPAAEMLRQLGITKVRLMTNNPIKVQGLTQHGVNVVERVPHIFPSNAHNEAYIHTKGTKGGHLF